MEPNISNLTEIRDLSWTSCVFFTVICCGNSINLINIIILLCCRKNGLLSVILQLSLIDCLSIFVIAPEIVGLERDSWIFSNESCQLFRGFEILVNSLVVYLMVCFNFHAISLWNLYEFRMDKTTKNPLTSLTGDDCSNECLIMKNDARNMNYSKAKSNISIIFPVIFVWFVCISISIPDFTLSTTMTITNQTLCAIVDVYHGQLAQYLLICFKIFIPMLLLIVTVIVLLVKLNRKQQDLNNLLSKKIIETQLLAKLGVYLAILFFITSFQRYLLQFLYIINNQENYNFRIPPFSNNYLNNYLAMLHYSGCILRGVLYIVVLPKFRLLIKTKLCCKSE